MIYTYTKVGSLGRFGFVVLQEEMRKGFGQGTAFFFRLDFLSK